MSNERVIVIGAGIAGLTAGIYAARSGFDVTIVEQHTIPGGMCTSWRRKGYLFEGAVHWLTGSSPNTALNELWRDTGALPDCVRVYRNEPFASVEWEGKTVSLYRDMERTRRHFLEVAPEDTDAINRLVKEVRMLTKVAMPVMDIKGVKSANPKKMGVGALINMLPAMPLMGRISKITGGEYASRFKHPALRKLMGCVPANYSATALLFTLATLASGDGGYPEGGSLPMTRRMADTFTSLGGKLLLGTKVKRVIVKDGAAAGVELDGDTLPADAVIISQETIAAVMQLFESPPGDEWLARLRNNTRPAVCTFVCVGVRATIPETPVFDLDEPITCGGITYTEIGFNNYAGYDGYAPQGGTALTTIFMDDTYDFWKRAKDEGRYEAEKRALAEQIERAVCSKYPQAKGNIEVVDIATPLTYERYTGAYRGSWMGVMSKGDKQVQYPGYLDSVKGVYFAGHRMMSPGGLPVALVSGRNAAQMVCRQFGAVFV